MNFTCQVFSVFLKKELNSWAIFVSSNKSALLAVIFRRRFHDFNVTFAISSFIIAHVFELYLNLNDFLK